MKKSLIITFGIILFITLICASVSYSINFYHLDGYPNYSPSDPIPGQRTVFNYVIMCEGAECTDSPTLQVNFVVNGSIVDTHTLTGRPHVGVDGQFYWNAVDGANVQIIIDPDNNISESNEADNSWSERIECSDPPRPDLYIYSCSYNPSPIAEGERITFRYRVNNSGRFGEVTTGPFTVALRVGGRVVGQNRHRGVPHIEDLSTMPEGTINWRAHCGEPITLVVDIHNEVDEGDESNNIYGPSEGPRPFECVPSRLNLVISTFDESHPGSGGVMAGSHVSFTADVKAFRIRPRNVRLTCGIVGGDVLYDHTFPTLSEYLPDTVWIERASFRHQFCPVGRAFRVYCEVDPDNAHIESDETDNREVIGFRTVENPLNPHLCPEAEPAPPPPPRHSKKDKYNFSIDFSKKSINTNFKPKQKLSIKGVINLTGNVISKSVKFRGYITKHDKLKKIIVKKFPPKEVNLTKGNPYHFFWKWLPKSAGNYTATAEFVPIKPKGDQDASDNKATMKIKLSSLKLK